MKKFFAVLAAVCLVLGTAGCQQDNAPVEQTTSETRGTIGHKVIDETEKTETESETTTAPQEAEINIETLAEGEKRDWSVEDVLKNDLKIDGIPISIPCTLSELLEALGDDYSVNNSDIEITLDGEVYGKFKDFTGEFDTFYMYYNGEMTSNEVYALVTDSQKIDYNNIIVIGYKSRNSYYSHGGYLSLRDLKHGDSLDKCLKNYGKPNDKLGSNGKIYLSYDSEDYNKDDGCFIQIKIVDNVINTIFAAFEFERLED